MYVGGLLFYCTGMMLMAMTRAKASVIIFSWAAGVMYSTLFTMPYLLVAHYHSMGTVSTIVQNLSNGFYVIIACLSLFMVEQVWTRCRWHSKTRIQCPRIGNRCRNCQQYGVFGPIHFISMHGDDCFSFWDNNSCCKHSQFPQFLWCLVCNTNYVFRLINLTNLIWILI